MHAAHIPDIFHDTTLLIVHRATVDREKLMIRTSNVRENYSAWYQRWQSQLEHAVEDMSANQISEFQRSQIELFCCYLEQFCLIFRLHLALSPSAGVELEEAVAEKSRLLLSIYTEYAAIGQPKYRMGLSAFIAKTILNTTDQWLVELSSSSTALTIQPTLFTKWCEHLRRKVD
jgi:hypothetical protein